MIAANVQPPVVTKLLLTPREAAAALSISERTLWGLKDRGEVPCVQIGRSTRYDPVALAAWIASQQAGAQIKSDA